jgi:hypothetical protein
MHAADVRHPGCPVCARPAADDPDCADCGWELRTPRRPGPVTAAMRAQFDQRLAAARRAHDARAAALIAAEPDRFAPWIRDGQPDGAEWASARRNAAAVTADAADEASAGEEVVAVLRGLARDGAAAIVEIGVDGIGVTRAVLDALGVPRFEPDQPVQPWTDLLPTLSAHPDERLFQLAGGLAGQDRAELSSRLAAVMPAVVPAVPGQHVLVICRPAGWPLLEDAARLACLTSARARLLRVALPPSGVASLAGGVLDSLTAAMPLLHGYGVVVASVDPVSGAVRPETRLLFQPGDGPGAEASVTLRRFPGDRDPATLAVAVDGSGPDSQVVSVYSVPQPEQPTYRVSAVLEAAGRIRFTQPRGITPDERPWPDLLAAMPKQVDVRPGPLDLVCAIELAGSKEQVDRRRDLVRALLERLDGEYPDAESLRVGLLGCTDHVFSPGEERRRVVRREPLGPVPDALAALGGFRGAEIRYRDAAPIEDMLHEAHRMLAADRAAGRAGRLLLVAGRRPHPPALGAGLVQPCPFRCDWAALIRQLAQAAVAVVAVADEMPGRAARNAFWAQAGRAGVHALTETNARRVGEDLGVFVRHSHRIAVPLPA